MDVIKIKTALISVSDKSMVVEFASKLVKNNVEIISTGGTYNLLKENKVSVSSVDSYTGHPEIMDGRVKTLHPKIHGGILALRDKPEHKEQMEKNNIKPIDLVVVNLYPFTRTIARNNVTIEEAIENIDIGGPTMIRSAAKNHLWVTVVVDPTDYDLIIAELSEKNGISIDTRKKLAVKAFRHTALYDAAIDKYLSKTYLNEDIIYLSYYGGKELRYGENPHQKAFFYINNSCREPSIGNGNILHGKEVSYNNIVDGDAALDVVKEFTDKPAAVVIKHTNPCGCATGEDCASAIEAAWSGDPVSAFGSIIAVSRTVDEKAAKVLTGRFVEVLIAPDFTEEALSFLREKSKSIRLIAVGDISSTERESFMTKYVTGGLLWQEKDLKDIEKWECVTETPFPEELKALALFSWKVCKHVKSNAIVLSQEYRKDCFRVLGMGAGQPNRVDSLRKLAITRAFENLTAEYTADNKELTDKKFLEMESVVLASDAFFPFPDAIEECYKAGIKYIVQPGGSKRDKEVIETANKYKISIIFTGMRHFKH